MTVKPDSYGPVYGARARRSALSTFGRFRRRAGSLLVQVQGAAAERRGEDKDGTLSRGQDSGLSGQHWSLT